MVYYNPYKQILRAFIRAVRTFISSLFTKRLLLFIIALLLIFSLFSNKQVQAAVTTTNDIENELITLQSQFQDEFVLFCLVPYLNNTVAWTDHIKPCFDYMISNNYDICCDAKTVSNNVSTYVIRFYYRDNYRRDYTRTYTSIVNGVQETLKVRDYLGSTYTFKHNISTNDINNSVLTYNVSFPLYTCIAGYKTQFFYHFIELINSNEHGSFVDYTNILNDINDYVSNIDTSNTNIYNSLQNVLSILNTIANKTENDYTEQITGITNQINSLNTSINNQTQQQHQDAQATQNAINNQTTKIEEQTNSINDMSNFMQDDNFSSDTITNNMPSSDEFQDITESGFDNIFTTLRNAFTSDNYQDVVITVPFSNGQTITIPSNLTENIIPTAIKTLIQMVYWYFIARFIVKDIASYIEKAKSGDIFSSSDTNIKTDML